MNEKYIGLLNNRLAEKTPELPKEILLRSVEKMHSMSGVFKDAREKFGSPLYLIDKPALLEASDRFRAAFAGHFEKFCPYFAMKSNNHPYIIKALSESGYGIDVSSGAEMRTALGSGAAKLVFSGPAKTEKELSLALDNSDKVIILMDSLNEFFKLDKLAKENGKTIRAGVRITAHTSPLWRKFGISLDSLEDFIETVSTSANVRFCGIQFHSSWNLSADNHCALIKSIGEKLSALPESFKKMIEFIDIGGGYWVEDGEWMLSETAPENKIKKQLSDETSDPLDHRYLSADSIEHYASSIADAYNRHIKPYTDCKVFAEPGRFVSHGSMHILLTVEDIKGADIAITDGATNILGWERYEMDYFPVVNISDMSLTEKPMNILGSLCTPHDVWGFAYFGGGIAMGDILVIPHQGAYTYSLRQNFIKDIAHCAVFDGISLSEPL